MMASNDSEQRLGVAFSLSTDVGRCCQNSNLSNGNITENAGLVGFPSRDSRPILESSTNTTAPALAMSTSAPTCSRSSQSNKTNTSSEAFKKAKDAFLNNLDSYIPVGVLRKRNADYNANVIEVDDDYPSSEIAILENHNWIRTFTDPYVNQRQWCYVRVWILPDDIGHKFIPRSSSALRRALKIVMAKIDRSVDAWIGKFILNEKSVSDVSNGEEDESLWYIFNTLQDPHPNVEAIEVGDMRDLYSKKAMKQLLSETAYEDIETGQRYTSVTGLKTPLYPYQRRTAATMVQREAQPARMLDPRLQTCISPARNEYYYYDKEEGSIVREKRMYSEACGGILAETMGCGKTLICLALILATRGHFPAIPVQYVATGNIERKKTGSLVEMAASVAGRCSLPWKSYFDSLSRSGALYAGCLKACEDNRGAYIIPPPPARYQGRNGVAYPRPPPQCIRLCSGTLIIVPPNLVNHWENEIANHTEGLKVLVLRNSWDVIPEPDDLLQYDIILFSRIRFEKEAGEEVANRRSSAKPVESPLTKLHWLRIIVDEGHNVAGHGHRTNMMHILDQLHVERRWVVSGTPSSGLYGVEVSLASQETNTSDTDLPEATNAVLRGRKRTGNAIGVSNELKDIDKLRLIVVEFLDLKPWSNSRADDPANWTKYMKPIGEDGKRRKAQSLRATLQSLVVRHRMEVIHTEIPLPRLHNKVVYLEPTFYDKLSLNLFNFILAVNAITSERKDQDYMFHPRNRKHLSVMISNLRQAGFWWTGFDGDISTTIDVAMKYLDKNRDRMAESDITMLIEGIQVAQKALACGSWNAFKKFHELGVYIQNFPSHARGLWALDSSSTTEPLLMGISQAHQAQKFVTEHLNAYDPAEGLAGAGIKARRDLAEREKRDSDPATTKKTMPDKVVKSPKKTFSKGLFKNLPLESPLLQTKLVATTSAKLTYLLNQVLELHEKEKIIIFYDNNNTAFWIAEGLELLGVDFRIYANTLKPALRTAYLTLFRETEEVRVLLMDLRQASHGLHIANASRVFIVNPIWQPNVESQAIKRAHRIGQTRPVFVETLVLKDTLEDKMLKRRKSMSDMEMKNAEKDLLDDSTMSSIIQNEHFIPMPEDEESTGLAYLKSPSGFFDRHKLPIPDDQDEESANNNSGGTLRKRKRALMPFEVNMSSSSSELDIITPKRRRSPANLALLSSEGIIMTPRHTPSPSSRPGPSLTGNDQDSQPSVTFTVARQEPVSIFGPAKFEADESP